MTIPTRPRCPTPAEKQAIRDAEVAAYAANPCLALPELEYALLELAKPGHARTKVRYGERETEYSRGDLKWLQSQVIRLRAMCGQSARPRQFGAPGNIFTPFRDFNRFR